MNPFPDISVVMGVFNGDRYLQRGLDSVLSQEGVELEFIVIDDGSTDESGRILADAAARDPRLRIIRQENAGLTQALIRGCGLARGRYIARQDGDDLSMPGRLRRQLELLDSDESLVMASSWAEVIGPDDEPLLVHRRPVDPSQATELLVHGRSGPPGHGSVMFRRDAYERVGGYRQLFYFAQDSDLWLRMAMQGRIGYLQEVLYRYRISPESISGRLHPAKLPYARLITALHEARLRGESEDPILATADLRPLEASGGSNSAGATDYFIARCLFGRRDARALPYLRRALAANPRNLRGWLLLAPTALLGLLGRRGQPA
jgi:glycosyltransferase involved in cell wall biosynthesis